MVQYDLVDGPFQGHVLSSTTPEAYGQVLDVEVVDVGDPPGRPVRHPYQVITVPQELQPGTLRYAPAVPHQVDRRGTSRRPHDQ